jgi:hypothetical protein
VDDLVLLGDVRTHQHIAYSMLLHLVHTGVDLLFGLFGLIGVLEVVDGYVGAVLGKTDGDGLTNPRCSTRDEHVLALEPLHNIPP